MKKFILLYFSFICIISITSAQSNKEMIFSNDPLVNNTNAKTSFTSAEYIYGTVDLDGKTIKDFFKIPDIKYEDEYYYLNYLVEVYEGNDMLADNWPSRTLVKEADIKNTVLYFDVLPEPSKASSVLSGTEKFDAGLFAGPLYTMIRNQDFKKNGTYTIKVRFYYKSRDAYGNEQPKEKWPECKGSLSFAFNENDVPAVLINKTEADAIVAENAFKMSKLPAIFSTPSKVNDPKVTPAKLAAILKRDRPERTMLKFVIGEVDGVLWKIATNDLDIPRYRYFTPYIHVAYKMDGKCYVGTVELIEEYLGGGKYGSLKVGFTSASNRKDNAIDCGKVK
jgi:hypothetical protein